jgi:sugar phosphate isomerase/epimerase
MCMVSMVVDQLPKQWGQIDQWPYQQTVDVREVLKKLAEIDEKLGAKDCYEPKKDEVIKQLQARIKELEEGLKQVKGVIQAAKDLVDSSKPV